MSEQYPEILDTMQVAELLGMNIQKVRKYAREGRIPAYRLPGGRTFRFFRDEIIEYLADHGARLDIADNEGRTPHDWARGVFLATHPAEPKPSSIALKK